MQPFARRSRSAKPARLTLAGWSLWELQLTWHQVPTQHLVGRVLEKHCGGVTSAISNVDANERVVTVESGSVYALLGPPGTDPDAQYRLDGLVRLGGATAARDITAEFAPRLAPRLGTPGFRPAFITCRGGLNRKAKLQLKLSRTSSHRVLAHNS